MPDFSLLGLRVIRELETIMVVRGKMATIVSDNGTELTSNAVLRWVANRGIEWHYIAPGKPMQNGFVESLNGADARRVPQRACLYHARRGSADRRGLAHRLQHSQAAWPFGAVASGSVRRYAETSRSATGRDAALARGLRAPPHRTINHQSKRGPDSTY